MYCKRNNEEIGCTAVILSLQRLTISANLRLQAQPWVCPTLRSCGSCLCFGVIYSTVPFFFLLLLEVSQAHQELVLVSPARPHQFLSLLKVLVTILRISAYYRRKELDWSLTATKDLRWYSVATTKPELRLFSVRSKIHVTFNKNA